MKFSEYQKLSKEERKKVPYKERPKGIKIATFFIIGVAIAVLIAMFTSSPSKQQLSDSAYFFTKEIVKENLKSPSTASFPFESAGTWALPDSIFVLKSYVDSQNEFGATLRANYYIKLQYSGGDIGNRKNWNVIDFKFE